MAAHYARQSVRSQSLSSAVMMTHDNCCIQMQSMLGENSQKWGGGPRPVSSHYANHARRSGSSCM